MQREEITQYLLWPTDKPKQGLFMRWTNYWRRSPKTECTTSLSMNKLPWLLVCNASGPNLAQYESTLLYGVMEVGKTTFMKILAKRTFIPHFEEYRKHVLSFCHFQAELRGHGITLVPNICTHLATFFCRTIAGDLYKHVKEKIHSKIIIADRKFALVGAEREENLILIILADLVDFLRRIRWWKFDVKIRRGTWSGRRQKNLGWRRRGRYYITGARHQEFESAEWPWIQPGIVDERKRRKWRKRRSILQRQLGAKMSMRYSLAALLAECPSSPTPLPSPSCLFEWWP